MRRCCGYRRKCDPSGHGDRHGGSATGRCAIAELASAVQSPTICCSGGCERTVVSNPCRNRGKCDLGGHGDHYGNIAIGRGAITQFTVVVPPPTIHRTRSREGTGMT